MAPLCTIGALIRGTLKGTLKEPFKESEEVFHFHATRTRASASAASVNATADRTSASHISFAGEALGLILGSRD